MMFAALGAFSLLLRESRHQFHREPGALSLFQPPPNHLCFLNVIWMFVPLKDAGRLVLWCSTPKAIDRRPATRLILVISPPLPSGVRLAFFIMFLSSSERSWFALPDMPCLCSGGMEIFFPFCFTSQGDASLSLAPDFSPLKE